MMNRSANKGLRAVAVVLAVCALSALAAHAKGYMTPGFRAKKTRPMRVVVLPPHAEFTKEKVVMTDEMVAEARALEDEAAKALAAQLSEKGYKARVLSHAEIQKKPGLAQIVKRVNDRYNEERSKIINGPKQVRKRRYKVGSDAVQLCAILKTDGIVFARVFANGVSGGKATMSAVFNLGIPRARSSAYMSTAVVEGRQGFVEGYFYAFEATSMGQLTKKPAKIMGQLAGKALSKYPLASEVETDAAAAEAAEDAEPDDGGDPLREFEKLTGSSK